MNRIGFRTLSLIALISLFAMIFKLGVLTVESFIVAESLQVNQPNITKIKSGSPVTLDIYGQGFDSDLIVSLVKNETETKDLSLSYPVEGVFNDSIIVNDILYLGSNDRGLLAIDVGNPLSPRLMGEYLVGTSISDIQEREGYLYLACGKSGVVVMEILGSGELDNVTDTPIRILAIAISFIGNKMVIAAGQSGVVIYDIVTASELIHVGNLDVGTSVIALESRDNFLYLATQNKTVEVFVFDNMSFEYQASVSFDESLKGLRLYKDDLYAVTADKLVRFDLVTSGHPERSGSIDSFGSADKIICGSSQIYIIDNFTRLTVVDPIDMTIVKKIDLSSEIRTVVEVGQYLLVGGLNSGLKIVDRTSAAQKYEQTTMKTPGRSHDIIIIDEWLYVADKQGGVQLKNLQNGMVHFKQISHRRAESFCLDRERKLLFVALGASGIEVFDVRDPGQPRTVALWPEIKAFKIAVSGSDLIVTKGALGIELIDIYDLSRPAVKKFYPDLHVMDLDVVGKDLYFASKKNGLRIYSIENNELNLLSETTTPYPMNQFAYTVAVTVVDDIAYVANGKSGLMIVDVKHPEKTNIMNLIDIPGFVKRVRVVDGKAFVSSQSGGVTVVDVKKNRQPRLASHINFQGLTRGLQVVDGLIYVTQRDAGISIIPLPTQANRIQMESSNHAQVSFPEINIAGSYDVQVRDRMNSFIYKDVVIVED
jgi:hypothetical protein